MLTTYLKLITKPKMHKKKEKKWNILPEVSDNHDPALQLKNLWDDLKQFRAAVAMAMQGNFMMHLHDLIGCPARFTDL
uniref:Uncharacterized protein n=1 Tax=Romanomermis culicivorax TaxID=13658 RepID=A0A915KYQ0_ROMCU